MTLFKVTALYLARAELDVLADSASEAVARARERWPDGEWRSKYGGAELRPPDKAEILRITATEQEPDLMEKL